MLKRDLRGLVAFNALALALAASLCAPHSVAADAPAASAKKKVLVGGFAGPKSDTARKAVIAALKADGEYDVGETSAAKPGSDDKGFAAASLGATAVLVGTVKKSGLVLSVRNGADGALVEDVEIKGDSGKLNKNIGDTLGLSVADAIAKSKPGAVPADAPAAAAGAEEKPAEAEAESSPAAAEAEAESSPVSAVSIDPLTPLELTAGLRAVHRSFTYHDTPAQLYPAAGYPEPLTYSLPLGPAVFIDGTVYPGGWFTRGPGAWFGLTGMYEINFATKTVYNEGKPNEGKLTTNANQYFFGVKARVPVSVHQVGLVAGIGKQTFNLLGDENFPPGPQVPDVWYKYIKVGAEGRFRFNPFSVGFHVGTRLVSNTGGLERDWFPGHVKTQSIEAGLEAGYTVATNIDLVCGFDLMRYAFDFNPFPADADPKTKLIAGGAVDQYTSGWLGVRYSLPGKGN